MVIYVFSLVTMHAKIQAWACLQSLELSTSLVPHQTYLSASHESCTCFLHLQRPLSGAEAGVSAEKEQWIAFMRHRIDRITFLGSTTLAIYVKDKRVMDASVFCSESWRGVLRSGPFWSHSFLILIIVFH